MDALVKEIFPDNLESIEEIYKKYPPRGLKSEQKITRISPSPTGFVHLGTIYQALINERIAHTTGGIFFVRIEDTDKKREVKGSAEALLASFKQYGITPDEGENIGGNYGPYKQSDRRRIYHVFIKDLILRGLAYPCFCSEEELNSMIEQQKSQNCSKLGYYGGWAKYRNFPPEEALKKIKNGEKFTIRLKSFGKDSAKVVVNDVVKNVVEFPENELDIVIMKQDGLPTYHFAHVVDDFLMGTNLVIRGDEWLPSLPLHIQIFKTMGWLPPKYAHTAPLVKLDENGNRRKLSKRKDPESNIEYFDRDGYPILAIIEYLMNLANSNFEDWRKQNPTKDYREFPFSIKKMGTSGPLFDFIKLNSVSRDVIGRMSVDEIYSNIFEWSSKYDKSLYNIMLTKSNYIKQILSIERDNPKKVRKDIAKWSEVSDSIEYFFNLDEEKVKKLLADIPDDLKSTICNYYRTNYEINDDNIIWFEKLKRLSSSLGYATDLRDYKNNPSSYKGTVSDIAKILRIMMTGRDQSPDLCSIMKILGVDTVTKRLIF